MEVPELGSIHPDPGPNDDERRALPANEAAEQQVLGAILLDNEAYHRIAGYLRAEHFANPAHQKIFAAMGQVIAAGGQAAPANLQHLHLFELSVLKPYGGGRYLGLLAQSAVAVGDVAHQAEIIVDLAARRGLIALVEEACRHAYSVTLDRSAVRIAADLQARLEEHRAATARAGDDHSIRISDFLKLELPPRELIIEPWLPTKGLVMITGKAGIGKTLIGLQLAWAITTGQAPIDGWTVPKPRRVLYVEGEMPAIDLQERISAVCCGLPLQPPDKDYFRAIFADLIEGGVPDLSTPEGQGWLEPQIGDAEVIVIDSITTLMPGQDQNEGHEWASTQGWLLDQRRRGRTVLLIHHNNKSGAQNGTERRMVPLDTAIDTRRPANYRASEGARFEVDYLKSRGFSGAAAEAFELTYRVDGGAAQWSRSAIREEPQPPRSANRDDDAYDEQIFVLYEQGKTQRDIACALNISLGKVQRRMRVQRRNGGNGHYNPDEN
jgi:RecA-family ATPase